MNCRPINQFHLFQEIGNENRKNAAWIGCRVRHLGIERLSSLSLWPSASSGSKAGHSSTAASAGDCCSFARDWTTSSAPPPLSSSRAALLEITPCHPSTTKYETMKKRLFTLIALALAAVFLSSCCLPPPSHRRPAPHHRIR